MRTTHIALATSVALSLAAPAVAEPPQETYSHDLQLQLDAGLSRGTISQTERAKLREEIGAIVRLERRYASRGLSRRETAVLKQRSSVVAQEIRRASRATNWGGREVSSNNDRGSADNYLREYRFAGPIPGDRYRGDAKIGQVVTSRIAQLPDRYRNDYVDNERVYYGYDSGRVYQIDRRSQMILALLDTQPSER